MVRYPKRYSGKGAEITKAVQKRKHRALKAPTKQNPDYCRKGKNPLCFVLFRAPTLLRFLCHDFCSQRAYGTLLVLFLAFLFFFNWKNKKAKSRATALNKKSRHKNRPKLCYIMVCYRSNRKKDTSENQSP